MDIVTLVLVMLLAVVVSNYIARLSPVPLPLPLLQIAIVLASTAIITNAMLLVWAGGGLSVIAALLMGIAVWKPFLIPIGH